MPTTAIQSSECSEVSQNSEVGEPVENSTNIIIPPVIEGHYVKASESSEESRNLQITRNKPVEDFLNDRHNDQCEQYPSKTRECSEQSPESHSEKIAGQPILQMGQL